MGACSCKGKGFEPYVVGSNSSSDFELSNSAFSEDENVVIKQAEENMKKLSKARGTSNILKQLGVISGMIFESRGKLFAIERIGCVGLVGVIKKNLCTTEILDAAYRILYEMAVSMAAKRSLCNAGLCEELVRTLREHSSVGYISVHACRLICLLCFDASCTNHLIELGTIEAVSACLSISEDVWKKHALDSLGCVIGDMYVVPEGTLFE